jgi:hypothetical protein
MLIGIKVQCTLVQVQIHEIKNIDKRKAMCKRKGVDVGEGVRSEHFLKHWLFVGKSFQFCSSKKIKMFTITNSDRIAK